MVPQVCRGGVPQTRLRSRQKLPALDLADTIAHHATLTVMAPSSLKRPIVMVAPVTHCVVSAIETTSAAIPTR